MAIPLADQAVLEADRARTGRAHQWGRAAEMEMSIEDCFNASDAMIADVSAVVTDYLQSNKPFGIVSDSMSVTNPYLYSRFVSNSVAVLI